MLLVLLFVLLVLPLWVFGWLAFARATNARAATALVVLMVAAVLTLAFLSTVSFDAGF